MLNMEILCWAKKYKNYFPVIVISMFPAWHMMLVMYSNKMYNKNYFLNEHDKSHFLHPKEKIYDIKHIPNFYA